MKDLVLTVEITRILRAEKVKVSDLDLERIKDLVSDERSITVAKLSRALSDLEAIGATRTKAAVLAALLAPLRNLQDQASAEDANNMDTILVVTALPLEYKAVVDRLEDLRNEKVAAGVVITWGRAKGLNNTHVGVLVVGQGNANAAAATATAIAATSPVIVAFVGIAGGLKDAKHGQVVVASSVYELGHVSEAESARSREKTIPLDVDLVQFAFRLAADRNDVLVGPLVSGGVLLKAEGATTAHIHDSMNDAQAIDMESWGFGWASHASRTRAIVVRGVSDTIVDKTPAADMTWQPEAAARAAEVLLKILQLEIQTRGR